MTDLLVGPVSVANLTAAAGVVTTIDGWWPALNLTWRTPVPASITRIVAQVREKGKTGPVAETVVTPGDGLASIVNGVAVGQHLQVRLAPAGAPGLPFQPTPWLDVTTPWDELIAALSGGGVATIVISGDGPPTRTDLPAGTIYVDRTAGDAYSWNGSTWRRQNRDVYPGVDFAHGYNLTKKGVVLQRGGSGAWDESLIHIPTVFWDPKAGKYRLMYDGFSGVIGSPTIGAIGCATSDDLEVWTKSVANPILQRTSHGGDPDQGGVGQPFCYYEDGTYYLFYVGTTGAGLNAASQSICLATSTDFAAWTRHGAIVSLLAASWRSANLDRPHVLRRGGTYYLFFQADNGAIGYATSPDLLTWTVDDTNSPILSKSGSGDETTAIGDFSPYRVGDTWYATYLMINGAVQKLGLAYAPDDNFPLGWAKYSGNPVLAPGAAGTFDAGGAARGGVFQAAGRFFQFYTATDAATAGLSVGSTWAIALAIDDSLSPTPPNDDLVVTSEALSDIDMCNLYTTGGHARVQKASAADLTKPANCFVKSAWASGATARIFRRGQWIPGTFTPGATYYLDTTAGGITTSAPAADSGHGQQIVGDANAAGTALLFDPQPMSGV